MVSVSPRATRLKKLAKQIPDEDETFKVLRSLQEEDTQASDRMAAILGATLLENALEVAILSRFIRLDDKKERSRIFDGEESGPLATFDSRIRVAFALGLCSRQTGDELDIIRRVRNAFAHSLMTMTFDTKEVKEICEELTQFRKLTILGGGWAQNAKDRYVASVVYISRELRRQVTAKPHPGAVYTPAQNWVPTPPAKVRS